MRTTFWMVIGAVCFTFPMPARAAEEKVDLSKVPAPVVETVKARFKDTEITGAAKEMEEDKTVYEITITHKGQHIDVTLSPEGELMMIEKQITGKDLPEPVTKLLEREWPKAKHKIVEEIVKVMKKEEKLAYYEVLLDTAEKKTIEVQVAADGKVVNIEEKTGADKDE